MPISGFALPWPIQDRIEALGRSFLAPPGLAPVDFSRPAGEPALIAPESVSWRIFKNPLSLFVGGVTAVLLELAEPRVRDGVWQHSSFRSDALSRLQRTGLAAMLTVYGPRSRAEAMIAGVVRAHGRVTGRTSAGSAYAASDPELLDWVQATASFGFINAYARYSAPLSGDEIDRAYAEGAPAAALYGATGAPRSRAGFDLMAHRMRDHLEPSPIIFEFLQIMRDVRALPAPARPLQRLLIRAAIDLVPGWIRTRIGLSDAWSLRATERLLVRGAAAAADRLILRGSPAVQSCRRLGLPDDFLYRR